MNPEKGVLRIGDELAEQMREDERMTGGGAVGALKTLKVRDTVQ
jgi:hypothetical protein